MVYLIRKQKLSMVQIMLLQDLLNALYSVIMIHCANKLENALINPR